MSAEVGGAGGGSGWPRSMAVVVADSGGAGLGPSGVAAIDGGTAVASSILGVGGLGAEDRRPNASIRRALNQVN